MKKIKLTAENAFVDAVVHKGKEKFFVVKMNAKTFYATTEENFLFKWKVRVKGITWKNFCDGHHAKSYKYEGFEIDDEEAAKKERVEAQKEVQSSQKHYLTGHVKAEVHEAWRRFVIKQTKGKGKAWQYPIHGGDTSVNIISGSVSAKAFLLNINYLFIFYFVEDGVYVLYDKKEHRFEKEIVWPVSPIQAIEEEI
jgi:hypothetical protein